MCVERAENISCWRQYKPLKNSQAAADDGNVRGQEILYMLQKPVETKNKKENVQLNNILNTRTYPVETAPNQDQEEDRNWYQNTN